MITLFLSYIHIPKIFTNWADGGWIKSHTQTALPKSDIQGSSIIYSHNLPCSGVAACCNHLNILLINMTSSCLHNIHNLWPFKLIISGIGFFPRYVSSAFIQCSPFFTLFIFHLTIFLIIASKSSLMKVIATK